MSVYFWYQCIAHPVRWFLDVILLQGWQFPLSCSQGRWSAPLTTRWSTSPWEGLCRTTFQVWESLVRACWKQGSRSADVGDPAASCPISCSQSRKWSLSDCGSFLGFFYWLDLNLESVRFGHSESKLEVMEGGIRNITSWFWEAFAALSVMDVAQIAACWELIRCCCCFCSTGIFFNLAFQSTAYILSLKYDCYCHLLATSNIRRRVLKSSEASVALCSQGSERHPQDSAQCCRPSRHVFTTLFFFWFDSFTCHCHVDACSTCLLCVTHICFCLWGGKITWESNSNNISDYDGPYVIISYEFMH